MLQKLSVLYFIFPRNLPLLILLDYANFMHISQQSAAFFYSYPDVFF